MDTSGIGVKLSCCEHYENVLYAYTDKEITAVNYSDYLIFYAAFLRAYRLTCHTVKPLFSGLSREPR